MEDQDEEMEMQGAFEAFRRMDIEEREHRAATAPYVPGASIQGDPASKHEWWEIYKLSRDRILVGENMRLFKLLTAGRWGFIPSREYKDRALSENITPRICAHIDSIWFSIRQRPPPPTTARDFINEILSLGMATKIHDVASYASDDYGPVLVTSLLMRRLDGKKSLMVALVFHLIVYDDGDGDGDGDGDDDNNNDDGAGVGVFGEPLAIVPQPGESVAGEPPAGEPPAGEAPPSMAAAVGDRTEAAEAELLARDAIFANCFFEVRSLSLNALVGTAMD